MCVYVCVLFCVLSVYLVVVVVVDGKLVGSGFRESTKQATAVWGSMRMYIHTCTRTQTKDQRTDVPPARHQGVGAADDAALEHEGGPCLATDKRGS